MDAAHLDLLVRGGLLFDGEADDGTAKDGVRADIGIRDGRVVAIARDGEPALPSPDPARGGRTIDATGCWVTPGFVDLHTHYDAEIEVAPALFASLRHGVTTVMLGSCSLGAGLGSPPRTPGSIEPLVFTAELGVAPIERGPLSGL